MFCPRLREVDSLALSFNRFNDFGATRIRGT